jgi:hypothetical protein
VADEIAFSREQIPDADTVLMRAHKAHFIGGELRPSVFRAQQGGMSVNWSKYATAEETKQQARNPAENAVLSLLAGGVRKIKDLNVTHTPTPSNRAHSEILLPTEDSGLTEVRLLLSRIATVALPLSPASN